MKNMTNTKDVILALKQVKEEKNLSLDKIITLIEETGGYVSKTTLSRVFAKGSEEQSFRYETTLRPIANALLDIETIEEDDNAEGKAYKSILKFKMAVIEENSRKIEDLQSSISEMKQEADAKLNNEKMKFHERLEKETAHFQRTLDFAMKQIELKDNRIDQLLEMNNQLMNQLLNCQKRGCSNENCEN